MSKLLWLYLVVAAAGARAQGTAADYCRAEIADTAYIGKVYNKAITWDWLDKENRFWYSQLTPTGKEFILVDVKKKTKARAFDHVKLAKALSAKSNKPVNPNKLPFGEIDFREKGTAIEFMVDSVRWLCKLPSYELKFVERLKPQPIPLLGNANGREGRRTSNVAR